MSKYMINKLIRGIELSDATVQAYIADPPAFVTGWLAGGAGPETRSDDRELTAEERAAFDTRDYAALYALGAHPYLLWHWVEAVYLHEATWPDMVERYRTAVTPIGWPDFVV